MPGRIARLPNQESASMHAHACRADAATRNKYQSIAKLNPFFY
jgi:hypothetical protein